MADQVLSAVARLLSHPLSTFLSEEGKLLGGLHQEIQLINIEFSHMKAFLEGVDFQLQYDNPQLKVWIRQVREVAYDTEDVLDEFMFFFGRPRSPGFLGYVLLSFNSIKNLVARHRLATKFQSIKAKIKAISEARLSYESKYAMVPAQAVGRPLPNDAWRYSKDNEALYAKETQLVGVEKPKEHLISQLLEGGTQLRVISVLGMGGIGKTTLAKKVYDDATVKSHFPIQVWVTVSQTYNLEELWKGIIRKLHSNLHGSAPPSTVVSMHDDELKAHIQNFLQQARYVIVFDDVWDEQLLEAFKFVLPENSYGGNRVMLTTRINRVASSCGELEEGYLYRMEFLSFEDSWTLFCRRTFKENSCPVHLKKVAESIVAKCEGLPLAIVTIGGVLASKSIDFSRMEDWELALRRIGNESEGTGKIDKARKILRLSYDDLPSHLKSCLLYMGIYPEDHKIFCPELMDRWATERFVEQRAGLDVEEVAWNYLRELDNRSLIIIDDFFYSGFPYECHIHDLLREFIVSESREINLITVVGSNSTQLQTGVRWSPENVVRRLVFHGDDVLRECVTQESHWHLNKTRSIITVDCTEPLPSQLISSKFIRMLALRGMQLEEIPNEIFKLFNLAHLDLGCTRVKVVPKSIKRLRNLEYLNLGGTSVRELPNEILKLQKFRVLSVYQRVNSSDIDFGYYGFKAPRNIGLLSELQILQCIDVSDSDKTKIVNEIGKLVQLKVLDVTNLRREDGKEFCSSLEKLTNLRDLNVALSVKEDDVPLLNLNHPIAIESLQHLIYVRLFGRLEKMPPWIINLQNLRRIDLRWSSLRDDPLESLCNLPNLEVVYLFGAYQVENWKLKAGGFPKLKELWVKEIEGLRWMRMEKGAMPCLKKLTLDQLPQLQELPFGTEHLRQLQILTFQRMASEIVNKLRREDLKEEEYKRIAHIPQVRIWYRNQNGRWVRHQLSLTSFKQPTYIGTLQILLLLSLSFALCT